MVVGAATIYQPLFVDPLHLLESMVNMCLSETFDIANRSSLDTCTWNLSISTPRTNGACESEDIQEASAVYPG